jgi:hypothetical protein
MKNRQKTVWVVMHYEYMRLKGQLLVSCLQSHVSSTRRKAEEYIRSSSVSPYSWWQVHPHVVDCGVEEWLTDGEEVYFYSHRGTPLRRAPFKRAEKAFLREEEKNGR